MGGCLCCSVYSTDFKGSTGCGNCDPSGVDCFGWIDGSLLMYYRWADRLPKVLLKLWVEGELLQVCALCRTSRVVAAADARSEVASGSCDAIMNQCMPGFRGQPKFGMRHLQQLSLRCVEYARHCRDMYCMGVRLVAGCLCLLDSGKDGVCKDFLGLPVPCCGHAVW